MPKCQLSHYVMKSEIFDAAGSLHQRRRRPRVEAVQPDQRRVRLRVGGLPEARLRLPGLLRRWARTKRRPCLQVSPKIS